MNFLRNTQLKRQFITLQKFNFSSRSHISQLQARDQELYEKVINNSNFSTSEFTNFIRIINKRKDYTPSVFEKINNNLSSHLNNMDELDIRKVCTALQHQQNLDTEIVNKLKEKTKTLRHSRHVDEEAFNFNKPNPNWSEYPLAFKFWINVAILKDSLFAKLSLK